MEPTYALVAGLLIGLAGSAHCLAMCGPLASSLSFGFSVDRRSGLAAVQTLAMIGLGKVGLYALLGAALGFGGEHWIGRQWLGPVLILNGTFLLMMGLYGLGLRGPNQAVERLFAPISRPVGLLHKQLMPIDSGLKALCWGGLWGLLPVDWFTPRWLGP